MTQWQYKTVLAVDLQGNRMNELGQQGWELIAILPERTDAGGARTEYIFKRKL